jgi:hypothetical protein
MHHDYVKYHFNRTIFFFCPSWFQQFLFHEKNRVEGKYFLDGEYHFRVKRRVDPFTRHVNELREAPRIRK